MNISDSGVERSVAITGGTSFVGKQLLNVLGTDAGLEIRILLHNRDEIAASSIGNIVCIKGDLLDPSTIDDLPTEDCTVINLAYLREESRERNIIAIHNLCQACVRARIKRLIHCSSAVVAGRTTENVIDEDTACKPLDDYEQTKLVIEDTIINGYGSHFEIIILRPTAIFGPEGQNLLKMANVLYEGSRIVNYLRSCLFNRRRMNLVSIDNVVSAFQFLISYRMKYKREEIFIISDDEDDLNAYRKLELFLMSSFGRRDYPVPVIPLPLAILRVLLKYFKKTNYNPLSVYSCRKLVDSGFKKEKSLRSSLAEFAEWYKSH